MELKQIFYFVVDLKNYIATVLLQCLICGGLDLHDVDEYDTLPRFFYITARPEEFKVLDTVLTDFTQNPLAYGLSEFTDEHEIKERAHQVEKVRKELYFYKTIE